MPWMPVSSPRYCLLKDLINLTFCCQQATVITDFSDLAAIGRDHYMNLHGGSASVDELNALDGKGTARQLIESGSGTVTPYGVVYDNGMKLEQVYDGRFFPCYYYKPNVITVAVTSKAEPEDTEPKSAAQIKNLAESLDLFDFAPGAHTPEEYGKYMIQQSGRFEYDENLDEFYDYEGYAMQRMSEEDGMFTDRGYIAYKGYTSLAEIMDGSQSSRMEMGDML